MNPVRAISAFHISMLLSVIYVYMLKEGYVNVKDIKIRSLLSERGDYTDLKIFMKVKREPFLNPELSLPAVGMYGKMVSMSGQNGMTDYELCSACHLRLEDVYEVTEELINSGYIFHDGERFILCEDWREVA